jgi:hypothetical protein
MVKGILLLLVAVYCNLAEACTCGYLSLDTTAVRSAQQVFVFRLISARIDEGASIGMNYRFRLSAAVAHGWTWEATS